MECRCIVLYYGHNFIADRIRMDNGLTFVNDLLKGLANLLRSSNEFTTAFVGGNGIWNMPARRCCDIFAL